MNVLLTGGSGMVGSFITPYLLKDHNVKVFDLTPPENQGVDFTQGSMLNPNDIKEALKDVEIFVNVTMKSPQGGSVTTQTIKEINENYELNTKGYLVKTPSEALIFLILIKAGGGKVVSLNLVYGLGLD